MKHRHVLHLVAWFAFVQATSASFVVDTFTEGGFELSHDGAPATGWLIGSPLGERRSARISTRLLVPGGVLESTLAEDSGTLSFLADGESNLNDSALYLNLSYTEGGPFSLEGYEAFALDFAEVEGSGALIVELGGRSVYGPDTLRVPITGAGTILVPFEMLNFRPNAGIDSFLATHFTFEAGTERFAFVLDEIRVIPEPGSGLCLLVGAALLLLRRQRAVPP
jgi:hypothetical protein